jgi:hypothetical protein
LHVRRDRGRWIEGFRNGFTRGYQEFSNQASNQQPSFESAGELVAISSEAGISRRHWPDRPWEGVIP